MKLQENQMSCEYRGVVATFMITIPCLGLLTHSLAHILSLSPTQAYIHLYMEATRLELR